MERDATVIVGDLINHLEIALAELEGIADGPAREKPAETAMESTGHLAAGLGDAKAVVDANPDLRALIDSEPELKARLLNLRRSFLSITDPLVL